MPRHFKRSRKRKGRPVSFWIPADVLEKQRIETNGSSVWNTYLPILDPEEPMEIDEPSSHPHEVQYEHIQASQWMKNQNEALNQMYLSKYANLSIQRNHPNNAYLPQSIYDICERGRTNFNYENVDDDYEDYEMEDQELMVVVESTDHCKNWEMQSVEHTDMRSSLELIAFIHWAASDHRVIASFQTWSSENKLGVSIFRQWVELNPLQISACIQLMICLPKQYIKYNNWVINRQTSGVYHLPKCDDSRIPEMYRKNELHTTDPIVLAFFIHWAMENSEVVAGFYDWIKNSSNMMSLFENWIISTPSQKDICQRLAAQIKDQNVQYQQWFADSGSYFVNKDSMKQ